LLDAALARENCKSKAVSTGCDSIDRILEGGFNYGAITSMAGASQAGKTLVSRVHHCIHMDNIMHYVLTNCF
jgi:archaellum biogenesis ATPase FlaH